MSNNLSAGKANRDPGKSSQLLRAVIRLAVFALFMAAVLFISAGRLNWVMAWLYIGLYLVCSAVALLVILSRHPDLMDERTEAPEDAKIWDRVLSTVCIVLTLLVPLPLAGLDARFGWSPQLPLGIQLAALVVWALATGLGTWAGASNKFYSRVVRIQKERGHVVVSDGPYQYVRHPGYVGAMLNTFALPLILGSLWTLIPAGIAACLLIVRTVLEDRTLQEELDGYKEYAGRVRYRLLPGVW